MNNVVAEKIAKEIRKQVSQNIDIAMILGSGWGDIVQFIEEPVVIPYSTLPEMPQCSVAGHKGNFVFGKLANKYVCVMQGRFHLYEGNEPSKVVLPVSIFYALGIKNLLVTNAAGGINENYNIGDLMIINDHINFTCKNPLTGIQPTEEFPIFIDMTQAYDKEYIGILNNICADNKISYQNGTYLQLLGPNYETPSEVKAFRIWGGDAVGMSTAIEVLMANYYKMRVAGVSCITNLATGLSKTKLDHKEVLEVSLDNKTRFKILITEFLKRI